MAKIRTLIAVELSPGIRQAAAKLIAQLASVSADYHWVQKDDLHITLNFLGDVPDTEIPDVCRVAAGAVSDFGSFELSACGLGCFPNSDRPRVVWLGVDRGTEEILALHEKLSVALESLRIPRERQLFRPHITLGRIQRGGRYCGSFVDLVARHAKLGAGTMDVGRVAIYSSFLDRVGPTHTIMANISLI